jgi:hypothetical protein
VRHVGPLLARYPDRLEPTHDTREQIDHGRRTASDADPEHACRAAGRKDAEAVECDLEAVGREWRSHRFRDGRGA